MEDRETSAAKVGAGSAAAWLFDEWEKARARDQAVLAMERRRYWLQRALAFMAGSAAGVLFTAAYFYSGR